MKSIIFLFVSLLATPTWAQDALGSAQLQAARERLDDAAQALAELHRELGPAMAFDVQQVPGPMRLGLFLGRPGARGIEIMGVTPDGPAARGGLESGDVLAAVNGQSLAGPSMEVMRELHAQLSDLRPDDYVQLGYERDGQTYHAEILIREPEVQTAGFGIAMAAPAYAMSAPVSLHMGPAFHDLNPGLGRYFGVESGVLVLNGSDDPAGLMPGDVVTEVDGVAIDSQLALLQALQDEDKSITVVRDGGALVMSTLDCCGKAGRALGIPTTRAMRIIEMHGERGAHDFDVMVNTDITISGDGP